MSMACSKLSLSKMPVHSCLIGQVRRLKIVSAFAADDAQIDVQAPRFALPDELGALPDDVAVEAAAQPAIARDDEHLDLLPFAFLQQGMGRTIHAPAQIAAARRAF